MLSLDMLMRKWVVFVCFYVPCFPLYLQLVKSIIDVTPMACKCQGVSGSCTVQTCVIELPEFSVFEERIRELHSRACRVQHNGATGEQSAWSSRCDRTVTNHDLIFNKDSPNYCIRDEYLGIPGVSGRECDPHSNGPNSCDNLCIHCGRTVEEHSERTEEKCECEFIFCCEIRCNTCIADRTFYTCT